MIESLNVPTHPFANDNLVRRLWIYQAERFPIVKTGLLLGVFSAASISVSAHLAGRPLASAWTFIAICLVVLIVFFQMRACDEYKDLEDDRRYRPERPIPGGLVSLRLIVGIAVTGGICAIFLTMSLSNTLLVLLLAVWLWLALMTVEFFAPQWLKERPILYLVTHMAIMPLIDLYVTASEWLPFGWRPPSGLWLFLCLSFINGCVLELGRKIWAPENEREGVETYSSLFGPKMAVKIWAATCFIAWVFLVAVGIAVGAPWAVALPGLITLLGVLWACAAFLRRQSTKTQKFIDSLAGLWVFVCYSLAGFAPLLAEWSGL